MSNMKIVKLGKVSVLLDGSSRLGDISRSLSQEVMFK